MSEPALLIAGVLLSLVMCEVVRRIAIRRALLDHANERSLHTAPTPRLGGVGIVVSSLAVVSIAWARESSSVRILAMTCAALALVGLRDDIKPVSAAVRFALQFGLSFVFLYFVGVPSFLITRGVALPLPTSVTTALLAIWIVGVLNIYNFMDGMDGLAGSQAVAAASTLSVLLAVDSRVFALAVGAAAVGFLAHNAPPARMFMGDAGSTFLGMAFAGLAVVGMKDGIPLTESALVLAPFLLDGTFTILRRVSKKERIWTPHRTHLYQRAVQTGLGHREVLLVYLLWFGVCALAAVVARESTLALITGWAVAVLGLLLVRRWVGQREVASQKTAAS